MTEYTFSHNHHAEHSQPIFLYTGDWCQHKKPTQKTRNLEDSSMKTAAQKNHHNKLHWQYNLKPVLVLWSFGFNTTCINVGKSLSGYCYSVASLLTIFAVIICRNSLKSMVPVQKQTHINPKTWEQVNSSTYFTAIPYQSYSNPYHDLQFSQGEVDFRSTHKACIFFAGHSSNSRWFGLYKRTHVAILPRSFVLGKVLILYICTPTTYFNAKR